MEDHALGEQLAKALNWHDAHTDFDAAVANIPPDRRGVAPQGMPYSPWQLVEHIRRAQRGILDFCISEDYREAKWPDEYWPETAAPPSDRAWDDSVTQMQQDRARFQAMARDGKLKLGAAVPNGDGQTYLRELVLAVDHTAFHVGQLVVVRRLLGIWPDE